MLQSLGPQRLRHDVVAEKQQQRSLAYPELTSEFKDSGLFSCLLP